MGQISTNEMRRGMKVLVEGQPYSIVSNEFVKPGKGQAFNRVKLKHLLNPSTIERTFKSGERLDEADVNETRMRLLYTEPDGAVFMCDETYEQTKVDFAHIGDNRQWLLEDTVYDIVFYNGAPVSVEPPTFMELLVTETQPGARGDTASGRVMKPATTESGAQVQIPIFIDQGERIKIDTRTGEYVSRASDK